MVLLDVREPAAWEAGHAPGAVHQTLDGLDLLDQGVEYVAVCRSGKRSGRAPTVTAAGLPVANMADGMTVWAEDGQPIVRDDGSAGVVD